MGVGRASKLTTSFAILFTLVFGLMCGVVAHAQVTGATLSGTITDPSGGVVVGAQVSVKDTATGINKDVTTDSAGLYSVPNLVPSTYEVKVAAAGCVGAKSQPAAAYCRDAGPLGTSFSSGQIGEMGAPGERPRSPCLSPPPGQFTEHHSGPTTTRQTVTT